MGEGPPPIGNGRASLRHLRVPWDRWPNWAEIWHVA